MSTIDAAIIKHITEVGSSSGGSGIMYTAGDAISLTSNKISVKYNPNTMEIIDGKLSAKSGSTGGSTGADSLKRIANQQNKYVTIDSTTGYLYIHSIQRNQLNTGLIIKIRNERSTETETYVLIRKADDITKDVSTFTDSNIGNASLLLVSNSTYVNLPVAIGPVTSDSMSGYGIRMCIATNSYTIPDDNHGAFLNENMSHELLTKIVCNYHRQYDDN